MGNQLPVQNSSTFTKKSRVWGSKFVVKRPSHQFNQTRIRTRNGLGALVQSDGMKFGIRNFLLALSGLATSFDFRSHLVNEDILLFGSTWWIQNPLTTKRLRAELNVSHIVRSRTLYWQFCWDLVPSKLTTHRHYWLLRTRSWSHRQFKLI